MPLWQFEVMPFGLVNSGATFHILSNVSNVQFYIDDVVIHSAMQ